MKPWSHLPNAHLIDWVLESMRASPDSWNAARIAARIAARTAARIAGWDAAYIAARDVAYIAARDVAHIAARTAARTAASDAILALVTYDDCQQYLDMTYDQLLTYAALSEKPQAVLLLPLKWVQENETLVASA